MLEPTVATNDYLDNHYIHKSNWLRAAVLGANDGILSTASIAIGVAAAASCHVSSPLCKSSNIRGRIKHLIQEIYLNQLQLINQTDADFNNHQ